MSAQKAGREDKRSRLCRAGATAEAGAGCTNKANGPRGGSPAAPNKPNRRWSVVQTKPIDRQKDPAGCTNKPNSHRAGQVSLDGKKGYVLRQRLSHKPSRFPGRASRQTPCGLRRAQSSRVTTNTSRRAKQSQLPGSCPLQRVGLSCKTKPIGVSRPELQVLGRYLGSEDSCETNPIPGLRQPGDEELPCETKPIRGPGSRLGNTLAGWHRPTCMGPHTQHFACGSPLTVLLRVGQFVQSPRANEFARATHPTPRSVTIRWMEWNQAGISPWGAQ